MKCKKVSFANEKYAKMYIDKLQKTSNRVIVPVRAYLCEKCFLWHLTSVESRENIKQINTEKQINNLKQKIINLQNENKILKLKLKTHKNV